MLAYEQEFSSAWGEFSSTLASRLSAPYALVAGLNAQTSARPGKFSGPVVCETNSNISGIAKHVSLPCWLRYVADNSPSLFVVATPFSLILIVAISLFGAGAAYVYLKTSQRESYISTQLSLTHSCGQN